MALMCRTPKWPYMFRVNSDRAWGRNLPGIWRFINFFNSKVKAATFFDWCKIYLGTMLLFMEIAVTMATTFWQACFSKFVIFLCFFFKEENNFLATTFTFWRHFTWIRLLVWFILLCLWYLKKQEIQDGGCSEIMTSFLRLMTRSSYVANLKINIFWTYYIPYKFHCRSFNSLGVMEGTPFPRSENTEKRPGIFFYAHFKMATRWRRWYFSTKKVTQLMNWVDSNPQ